MIEIIGKTEFVRMVERYHYSKVMPKINKVFLADRELGAVVSLGLGVRPKHTIQKLFPSLGTSDYYEIGKMCASDESPHGTESLFLSRVINWIKLNRPKIRVLFTWSDGMMGKPGYVYQSSNFLYGGYIWTDTYLTADGEKVHPRQTNKIGGRPNLSEMANLGWLHYKGKQFRYCYFLCSNGERKRLLRESTVKWTREYPKDCDLLWKRNSGGVWVDCDIPAFNKNANSFSSNAKQMILSAQQGVLFGDIYAMEVSRETRSISNA